MEDANSFLSFNRSFAGKISLGCLICTLCPAPLLAIMACQKGNIISMTEDSAGALGTVILLALVALSLVFFIPAGIAASKWEWLEKEVFDTEYGVDGMVRSRTEKFHSKFVSGITAGVVSILVGVIVIVSGAIFDENNEALLIGLAAILLAFIAAGVFTIVRVGVIKAGHDKLLQEGDYRKEEKIATPILNVVAPVYWLIVTGGFLAWSFATKDWRHTWIVWPVAGVLYAAIAVIIKGIEKSRAQR